MTRSRDTFLVNDAQTLLERNEVRVSHQSALHANSEVSCGYTSTPHMLLKLIENHVKTRASLIPVSPT